MSSRKNFRSRPRHGRRYRQIASALARHGMGYLLGVLGLERFVPFHRGFLGHPRRAAPYTRPEHLRLALEDLGTTFIKLGQILSTRADLLPPDFQTELAKLQDQVPPLDFEIVREEVSRELGHPIEEVFAAFDPQALATGSIGQAHLATLPDGTEVVVKVRRPGVVEQVEEDLEILQGLAEAATRRWELARQYDLVTLAQEFAETLRAELDYISEGQNADYFANLFRGESGVHIPRVYWEATTSRVITLERIKGTKVSDLGGLEATGVDRKEVAQRAGTMLLRMVFEAGTFHADPHPGNIFIEADGIIGLIDFGMVGVLDDATREQLAELFLAVSREDVEGLVDALVHIGIVRRVDSLELLKRDLQQLFDRYYHRSLGDIRVGQLLGDVLTVTRRHHLQLPSNLFLLIKTLIMSEGLGAQLDPGYNLSVLIKPFATKLLLHRYSPAYWGKRLGRVGGDLLWLGFELPTQLRRLARAAEGGNLVLPMHPVGLESTLQRLEGMVNRLVLGMVLAAFLVGLALLMTVYHPLGSERWMGVVFGFGLAVVLALGAYLLRGMINRGRGPK